MKYFFKIKITQYVDSQFLDIDEILNGKYIHEYESNVYNSRNECKEVMSRFISLSFGIDKSFVIDSDAVRSEKSRFDDWVEDKTYNLKNSNNYIINYEINKIK